MASLEIEDEPFWSFRSLPSLTVRLKNIAGLLGIAVKSVKAGMASCNPTFRKPTIGC